MIKRGMMESTTRTVFSLQDASGGTHKLSQRYMKTLGNNTLAPSQTNLSSQNFTPTKALFTRSSRNSSGQNFKVF
eukprot:2308798-Amphidinium_carterae.2